MLDLEGVIRDATLSNAVAQESAADWVGRAWVDTVDDTGGDKVLQMLVDAREGGLSAFRQVTQRFPSGLELPMEYTTVRLGGKAGLIAIGRNLQAVADLQTRLVAAQQAMEQEYWKLREVESRYRLLFDASNEAVLLLRADTLKIAEANPAAIRSLGLSPGRDLVSEISANEQQSFLALLQRVRQNGRAPGVLLHLGADRQAWLVRASLMTSEPGPLFLVQLALADSASPEPPRRNHVPAPLEDFVDRLPDALVIIDRDGTVRRANRAFLDLVQVSAEDRVLGERMSRWLSHPGGDLTVLLANISRHGSVRLLTTGLQGELGGETAVEISAVGNTPEKPSLIALLIRDVGRRMPQADDTGSLQSSLAAVIEQSGNTPLRVLIRDTVSLVERHFIGAALQIAGGNRTAAAELLGLSRQGFYKKLGQYEMDSPVRNGSHSRDNGR
jgi:transcriptional regulator PpsR